MSEADRLWGRFAALCLDFDKSLGNAVRRGEPGVSLGDIAAYLEGREALSSATVGLSGLAGYWAISGCARVMKGDKEGFREIDRACLFSASKIRLLARAFELDNRPKKVARIGMDTLSGAYLHASAIGAASVIEQLAALVRAVDQGAASVGVSSVDTMATLVAWMVLGRAPAPPSKWAALGPYSSVTARKHTPADYDELARFHVREAVRSNGELFQLSPLAQIPFELRAIEAWSGVPIENPTHPLLTSPLAVKRSVPVIEPTEELKQVLAKASVELQTDFSDLLG